MMPREHDRRRFLATLGAASVALLPGCGAGGSGTETDTGRPDAAPTDETAATDPTASATASQTTATATTEATDLTVEAPEAQLQDEPAELRISGADPGAEVTVEASMPDYQGQVWSSETTFEADEEGAIDLGAASPVSGSYEGADPMGWLWSMQSDSGDTPFFHAWDRDRKAVTLRASDAGGSVETTLDLRLNDPGISVETVETDELAGILYEPAGDGPHPGVLTLHGSGGNPPRRRSQLLATRGYAAFAVKYFGSEDPIPDRHDSVPLSYFERAQSWLRDRDGVRDAPVGVLGISRGGELALLLGARTDWVGSVVSVVGSVVGWEGGGGDPPQPAWTHDGETVPYLTWEGEIDTDDEGNVHVRPAVERRLESVSESELEEATFAVEETEAPILMLSAGDDQVWPSRPLSERAADRLRAADFDYAFEHRTYEDAGHYLTAPYLPTAGRRVVSGQLFGGAPAAYARAYADSWPAVLDYLDRGLREE